MNKVLYPEDVIITIKSFLNCNDGDESTEHLILAIGCELLDVSEDKLIKMIEEE